MTDPKEEMIANEEEQTPGEMAVKAGPGALSSPLPPEGSDLWAMPADAFEALTHRAVAGELLNMKGDL